MEIGLIIKNSKLLISLYFGYQALNTDQ